MEMGLLFPVMKRSGIRWWGRLQDFVRTLHPPSGTLEVDELYGM